MMALQRGFKTEAEALAQEVRTELGIKPLDVLDPWALGVFLKIPIIPLSSLSSDAASAVRLLQAGESRSFSAVTVFAGHRRIIVHNDQHADGRQHSNICHELAHALLRHEPHHALDDKGCRLWMPVMEEEADWLAGALLVTPQAALTLARSEVDISEAARRYEVSVQMLRWRINMTGAGKRVSRKVLVR